MIVLAGIGDLPLFQSHGGDVIEPILTGAADTPEKLRDHLNKMIHREREREEEAYKSGYIHEPPKIYGQYEIFK